MFEKIKEKHLSNYVSEKLKISEAKNEKNEGLKNYFESQGLDPELKDKNILFDIAYRLQQTNADLEKKNDVFVKRLLEHEIENINLEKENKDINKRIDINKNNIDIFKNTLDNYYEENKGKEELDKDGHLKIIENTLKAYDGPLGKDKNNIGLTVEALVNDWLEEGKTHSLVMDNINDGLKKVCKSKGDENVVEMER